MRAEEQSVFLPVPQHRHRGLQKLASDLKHALSTWDSDNIFAHAHHFRRTLIDHIREEEAAGGLYASIEARAPKFFDRLAQLRMQHAEILANVEMIREASDEDLDQVAVLIEECLHLVDRHEVAEEALLADLAQQLNPTH